MADLPLVAGTMAQDCYPQSVQALYQEMFDKAHAIGPNVVGLLIQDGAPDPADRNKGWIPTSAGVPIYPGFVFVWHANVGHWVSRHPKSPADPRPEMYIGALADLNTLDGGDAGAPGIASGPMWEQWTPITGRVPIGVGLIPGSSPAASVVTVLDTVDSLGGTGEYKTTLTSAQGASSSHVHPIGKTLMQGDDDSWLPIVPSVATPGYTGVNFTNDISEPQVALTDSNLSTLSNQDVVTTVGHNNMQPFIGVYWIRRTAVRQFYRLG